MPALITSESSPTLLDKQRAALISLLADDDPAIYQVVRVKLLSYGRPVCEWLRPYLLSPDPVLRRRALDQAAIGLPAALTMYLESSLSQVIVTAVPTLTRT